MSRNGRDPNCTLIVRNLADGASSEELKDIFKEFGILKDVYIPLDYYTRRQRGFAYVQFEDPRDAKDALNDLDGTKYLDSEMRIDIARGDRKTPHEMKRRERGDRYDRDDRRRDYDRRSRRYHDDDGDGYRRRNGSRDRRKRSRSSSRSDSPSKRRRYESPEVRKRFSRRERSRSDSRCKRRGYESSHSPKRASRSKSRSNSKGSASPEELGHKGLNKSTPKSPVNTNSPNADDVETQKSVSPIHSERRRPRERSHESRSRSRSSSA